MSFCEKWIAAVDKKNSVVCAGLDPAEFEMDRPKESLPAGRDKKDWSLRYIEAVAPYSAAVKYNLQYWKSRKDSEALGEICDLACSLGLVVIEDSKIADIGSTNDAGFFHTKKRSDAVTLAPFAGNISESAGYAGKRNLGLISMCLMSNPEYLREKNKLCEVLQDTDAYRAQDTVQFGGSTYVRQYVLLAQDSRKFGLDGIVIGAPSSKNHILASEIETARYYAGDALLVLMPGIGAQKGQGEIVWKHFGPEKVLANVGRGIMFPNGVGSTPEQQAEAARQYQLAFNYLRR